MSIMINRERPDTPDATSLILELEDHLAARYPAVSRHGYSVDKLIRENVHFFVLRHNDLPASCGGVQFFPGYAELKRMYTRPAFRGQGFARAMLEHLAAHVRTAGVSKLRLETGVHQAEAVALYEKFGFLRIGPFGNYTDDPLSLFLEMSI